MEWEFAILERNGRETVIEQPEGWDSLKIVLKRDLQVHGTFFDYQSNDFIFRGLNQPKDGAYDIPFTPPYSSGKPGAAFGIIKHEYDNYGVKGDLILIIRQDCGYGYEELYRGKLLFSRYKEHCGDDCFCKIPMELTGDVMLLKNRWDQEVDLESLKSFDGDTNLDPYKHLGSEVELKSKGIFLQNKAELVNANALTVKTEEIPFIPVGWFNIVPQTDNLELSEFGNFNPSLELSHTFVCSGFYLDEACPELYPIVDGANNGDPRTVYFDWASTPALLYYNPNNSNNLEFITEFKLKVSYSLKLDLIQSLIVALNCCVIIKRSDGGFEMVDNVQVLNIKDADFDWGPGTSHIINYDKTFEKLSLKNDEYLFVVVAGVTTLFGDGNFYTITTQSASIEAETISYSQPSKVKMFLANEALSRVAEAVTDNKIRAYSEYFGRTDSEPYAVEKDGCGSLEALTKGLFIRGITEKNDEKVNFSVSMKDLWNGLNPIHNIGWGIETDRRRLGYQCLRVEPWKYFYRFDVVMECHGVASIDREVQENEHYSTFVFGYEKWEAEEYNGLDEFLSKRKYRTTLGEVQNELSQLSKMVASGYAIEITKRKGSTDSRDWRYDNDTFIICMKRGGTGSFLINFEPSHTLYVAVWEDNYSIAEGFFLPGRKITVDSGLNAGDYTVVSVSRVTGNLKVIVSESVVTELTAVNVSNNDAIAVEQGGIDTPLNVIDPDTIYNFRISPVRNAMRWSSKVFASYRNMDQDSSLIFTNGEGNYFAYGLMSGGCVVEMAAMMENETIALDKFANPTDGTPFMRPERISFQYPLSLREFKTIMANPYGLIAVMDSCEVDAGWIEQIDYSPSEGMAEFKIIPAYPNGKLLLEQGIFSNAFSNPMV